jgi:hypothetical protein
MKVTERSATKKYQRGRKEIVMLYQSQIGETDLVSIVTQRQRPQSRLTRIKDLLYQLV